MTTVRFSLLQKIDSSTVLIHACSAAQASSQNEQADSSSHVLHPYIQRDHHYSSLAGKHRPSQPLYLHVSILGGF